TADLVGVLVHQPDMEEPLSPGCAGDDHAGLFTCEDHAFTSAAAPTARSIESYISYPCSASRARPSASFVPAIRTITGCMTPASMIPRATSSQRVIPPSRFTMITRTPGEPAR